MRTEVKVHLKFMCFSIALVYATVRCICKCSSEDNQMVDSIPYYIYIKYASSTGYVYGHAHQIK
jgi:hypothetical protein